MTSPVKHFRPNFTLYPLLWIAICFALGIFLASIVNFDWSVYLVAAISTTALSLIAPESRTALLFTLFAFVSTGAFSFQVAQDREPQNSIKHLYDSGELVSGDPVEIDGVIDGGQEIDVGGFYIKVKVNKISVKGISKAVSGVVQLFAPVPGVDVQNEYNDLNLSSGVRVRIGTLLSREEKYLNPGGISYVWILDQKGIDATGIIKSPLLVETLDTGNRRTPISILYDYRKSLIERFRSNFNVSTSGILIASLLGNKHHLSKETADIFRDGGTFHILVISGLHVTFVGGLILVIVRSFTRRRLVLFFVPTSVLWVYAIAVGAEVPVVRAAAMFTVLMFAYFVHRTGTLLNALGACALIILFWEPRELFSQSFHLTFISLVGIVAAAFPLIEKLRAIGNWSPNRNDPFPPNVPKALLIFCETIFWSERSWQKKLGENVWKCRIFKSSYAELLEMRGLQKPSRRVFEGLLVTVVVQIFLLPFLVVYFHRISFASVILNLWVSVFIVFQNGFALLSIFVGSFNGDLSLPFVKITELFNSILLALPKVFINYELASIRLPVYSGIAKIIYAVYFVPLIGLILILNLWDPFHRSIVSSAQEAKPRSFGKISAISIFVGFTLLLAAIVFHPFSSPKIDGRLTVDFLDVGQGDAALVTFPNGKTMLIDGGGKHIFKRLTIDKEYGDPELFDPDSAGVGETVVSEFLWEKGYSKIDYILATHADADHMQGLISVAKNFAVKWAMIGVESPDDETFIEFKNVLADQKIPILTLAKGKRFTIGGVSIDVLNPTGGRDDQNKSSNNNSVLLQMTYRSKKFLFTGDIEKVTEYELLKNPHLLKADIVKVSHHGSSTSSTKEFIGATGAEYAVIPVGKRSPFGHPNEDVVARWKASGANVLTTGKRGTITISTNGIDLEVKSFLK